jgi:hypothetical protein
MRSAWFVAPPLLAALACASGTVDDLTGEPSGSDAAMAPPATSSNDASAPAYDAGGPSSSDVAVPSEASGDGTTEDGGPVSTLPDVVTKDTGAPTPTVDASVPVPEAGSCGPPVDISSGGTFTVDTCTATVTVDASCGTTAAAVILRGDAPASGSNYEITLPSGWVLQTINGACDPGLDSCGSTGTWSVSGATSAGYWWFAVEPESGVCGTTTVTVDRIM